MSLRSLIFAVGVFLGGFAGAWPASASTFQSVYQFPGGAGGAYPSGRLVMDKNGILYGVTVTGGANGRGTIFSFAPTTNTATVIYSFTGAADGANPQAGLAYDGAGHLYGVAARGAVNDNGTLFKFTIATQALAVLHSFSGGADGGVATGALLLYGGSLYGTTQYYGNGQPCGQSGCGTVFRYVLNTKAFSTVRELGSQDGVNPLARLARFGGNGLLYGTAYSAGPNGSGALFSYNPANGAFAVAHGFSYHVDGSGSGADVAVVGTKVYGTMAGGGPTADGYGTIYRYDPSTGLVTTLYSFTGGADGIFPGTGVTLGPLGYLYGVTNQGGASSAGVVYKFNPNTHVLTPIHAFAISDGSLPSGPLLYKNGVFYGVTSGGNGTIYEVIP